MLFYERKHKLESSVKLTFIMPSRIYCLKQSVSAEIRKEHAAKNGSCRGQQSEMNSPICSMTQEKGTARFHSLSETQTSNSQTGRAPSENNHTVAQWLSALSPRTPERSVKDLSCCRGSAMLSQSDVWHPQNKHGGCYRINISHDWSNAAKR